MIRKTAFLVTGTVTGLVAVLSYNPPKLSTAIAASGSTTTPTTTGSTSTNSAANPATTSTAAATTNTPVQPQATKSSASKTSSSTSSSSNTSTQNSTTTTAESPAATPTPVQKQSSGSSGTYKGETIQTRWGPVQVQVTLSNGKITDISTLQYPNGDRRSQMISSQVIPWLQQEALQAQSANISGIGGATYTSVGFINSLASALQKAGL